MSSEQPQLQETTSSRISLRQIIGAAVFLTAIFIRPPQIANNCPISELQDDTPRVLVIEQPDEDAFAEVFEP